MEASREEHLVAVKRILRYVAGTRGWGVRYCAGRGKEKLKLVGYSDSDMAGDVDDRKSTSGMIYFLSGDAMYKQLIGSLMYLTATRPDLMYVVSLMSRFMASPTELHLQAAKRVLRYLKGTIDLRILYRKRGNGELIAYTDNDYAGNIDDRTSTSRYVFLLSDGAVSWS